MRLYLIRHALPPAAAGLCYGRSDPRVAPAGQASLLPYLMARLPRGAPVFSSPLQRCAALAGLLAPALGSAGPVLDARLAEMDFGAWEMQAWSAIPRAEIDAWAADVVDYRPGGGESVRQVAGRVQAFCTELRRLPQATFILVTHAGIIRLLQAGAAAADAVDAATAARRAASVPHAVAYGSMTVLDL